MSPGRTSALGPRAAPHRAALSPDATSFFEVAGAAVEAARERVWLATYIYRDDPLGRSFAERLARAARRGADVRLLYGPHGSVDPSAPACASWPTYRA